MSEKKDHIRQMLDYIKAQYQLKYGIEMDDWFAVNIAESKEHFDMVKRHLDANRSESKRLHETFKGSVKSVHFASERQSLLYGLGISLPYAICGLVLGMLVFFYLRTFDQYEQISQFVTRYENSESYINLVQTGKIKTVNGEEILVLKPKNAESNTYGQIYEFDAKRKEVLVPLRKLK